MAFGKDQDAQSAGRAGGNARSESKVAAARANGAKGGRPRKPQPVLTRSSEFETQDSRVVVTREIFKKADKIRCRECDLAANQGER